MVSPGTRVFPRIEGATSAQRARFAPLPAAIISDNMGRACGTSRLNPLHGIRKMIGNAVTVKTRPGDNLLIHRAMDILETGDVLVVDGAGALDNALVGELLMLMAIAKGATGFVIDGAVRDVSAFRIAEFPCYARGVTHRGPYKDGPGEINVPVAVDGMVIHPGDIVIGDEDGLVAIRPDVADDVIASAIIQMQKETLAKTQIQSHSYDRKWLAPLLAQRGVGA